MSAVEEKGWVEPYVRADGTEVAGYWREGGAGVKPAEPQWLPMPDEVDATEFANGFIGMSGKLVKPGTYQTDEIFIPILHEKDDTRFKIMEAMNTVNRKHMLVSTEERPLRTIPILHVKDDEASARYYGTVNGATVQDGEHYLPSMITVGDDSPVEEVDARMASLVHEFGHYIDQQMLGQETSAARQGALDEEGPLAGVMDAIWTSRPFAQLRFMLQLPDDHEFDTTKGPLKINKDFINYLMDPPEAFARAYAQWALEGTSDTDWRYLRPQLSNDQGTLYPQQWTEEEFSKIAKELDKAFKPYRKKRKKAADVPFEEIEHPRDPHGRFTDKPWKKIKDTSIYRARWPLSFIDGDWLEPVRLAQERDLPSTQKQRMGRFVKSLGAGELRELVQAKESGDEDKWTSGMRKKLEELPVGTQVKVYDDPLRRNVPYTSIGTFIKLDDRWASTLDPGARVTDRATGEQTAGTSTYPDRMNSMLRSIGLARGVAEATNTWWLAPEQPWATDPQTYYDDLDVIMEAGNAIHAEVGRRLREKGFGDITQIDMEDEIEERRRRWRSAIGNLYDVWHDEIRKEYKARGLVYPEEIVQPFEADRWNSPWLLSMEMPPGSGSYGDWMDVKEKTRKTPKVRKAAAELSPLFQEYSTAKYNPELVENTEKFRMRRDTILEVLSEARPMGGGKYKYRKATRKDPIATADEVAKWLPDEWVSKSNEAGDNPSRQLRVKHLKKGRGFYSNYDNEANASPWRSRVLDDNAYFSVMAHELIHRAEYTIPEIKFMEWVYYQRRLGGEPLVPLQKLYPRSRYRKNETTRPDELVDAYAGKDYGNAPDSAYEIMTTGVQDMLTGVMGIFNYDADQAKFTLGMLAAA